jgi:hypothetical protein
MKPLKPVETGKKVKCAKCGSIFVARDDKAADTKPPDKKTPVDGKAAPAAKAKEPAAAKKPADDDDDGPSTYGFLGGQEPPKPPEPPVVKKKKPLRDEDDDEDEDEDDEGEDDDEDEKYKVDPVLEQYLKQDRSTDPRGPATEIVSRPSGFMTGVYAIIILGQLAACVYWIFPFIFSDHFIDPKDLKLEDGVTPYFRDDKGKPLEPMPTWKDIEEKLRMKVDKKKGSSASSTLTKDLDAMMDQVVAKNPAIPDKPPSAPDPRLAGYSAKHGASDAAEKLLEEDKKLKRYHGLMFVSPLILLVYCGVIVYGSVKMQGLESYGWSWTAVIMALIPLGNLSAAAAAMMWLANLLGPWTFIDFGNWPYWLLFLVLSGLCITAAVRALMAMMQPIVKDGFFFVPED